MVKEGDEHSWVEGVGELPSLLLPGEMSLEELTANLSVGLRAESNPSSDGMLIVEGKGVYLKDKEGKYRLLNLAEAEWAGKAKLSESTKKLLTRYRPKVYGEELRKKRPKKKRRRVSEYRKKKRASHYQRTNPKRCEFESKRYRKKMADPYKSWVLYGELKKGYWNITLDEWLDHVWPVYSQHFVWIRRWTTKEPFSINNLFLQLRSEHSSKYIKNEDRLNPKGVIFDGRDIKGGRV